MQAFDINNKKASDPKKGLDKKAICGQERPEN
jgi:hypothetical protein